ncbi:hypothetical protein FGG08_005339 [Glutinoglossum americanum]|uniref:Azaphilone pigments biosynthesis cluster protein L N-terminal domain-containing protein n=1 Tax=Glutinoglossum americanum TaxID=1670608 RepID=A0A9P8I360_9PEZI|nr:hypothetical protein FGG08_005339 [Glutinoglossum americanum]
MAAGLGEAAGIAGIISLTGQTVKATSALYIFCKSYKDVNSEIAKTNQDLKDLRDVLYQCRRLATGMADGAAPTDTVDLLTQQITRCQADVKDWNQKFASLGLEESKGAARFLKRLRVAADRSYFSRIMDRISSHKEQIALSLGVLETEAGLCSVRHSKAAKAATDALQVSQNSLQNGTFQRLDAVAKDVSKLRSEQSTSSGVLHDKLEDMEYLNSTRNGTTQMHLTAIDARLKSIQKQLQKSVLQARAGAEQPYARCMRKTPPKRLFSSRARRLEFAGLGSSLTKKPLRHLGLTPLRLVKPGILLHEKNGQLMSELLALDDEAYAKADRAQKIALIEYVGGLRLVVWLLQKQNYLSSVGVGLGRNVQSNLTLAASLTSLWESRTIREIAQAAVQYALDLFEGHVAGGIFQYTTNLVGNTGTGELFSICDRLVADLWR